MSRSVFEYEGTIAQVQGDALISFFGAPVAHEDDPERAVRAAIAMTAAIESYSRELTTGSSGIDFGIRIGISTGLVLVGQVGSDLRYDYTAVGDTMNLAARLQAQAPGGGVLLSDRTERFVGPLFELEDIGAHSSSRARQRRCGHFVSWGPRSEPRPDSGHLGGRQAYGRPGCGTGQSLVELSEAVVRAGRGRVALVVGEPGMGKSRLLRGTAGICS